MNTYLKKDIFSEAELLSWQQTKQQKRYNLFPIGIYFNGHSSLLMVRYHLPNDFDRFWIILFLSLIWWVLVINFKTVILSKQ